MANNNFMAMQPSNASFEELIGNGVKYVIPKFQRDYSWDQEQWEDLWTDITGLSEEKYHYMGYVVLQRKNDNTFEVIDGQQRLITLSIIVLAALKQLESLVVQEQDVVSNKERIQVNRDKYIGFKHPVTLTVNNKLTLNRNNASYFKRMTAMLEPANHRSMSRTNKLLRNAFNFFVNQDMGHTGEAIAQTIYNISNSMIFTKIIVEDDVNAYKVFETLNARGVQLSTPDLLKNYIFSVVTQNDDVIDESLDDLDGQWSEIISDLGDADFTDFVRYHYNFQQPLLTKKKLFTSIKKLIPTPEKGLAYLESLYQYAPIFSALLRPQDDWWQIQGIKYKEAQEYLEALSLFNIKQPIIILMIAFNRFDDKEFVLLAKYLYVLSIRYNVVCHLSPNEQEKIYNQIAMNIYHGTYTRASHVKNDAELFKRIYPMDEDFKRAFEWHWMPSRQSQKKIRFMLSEIEMQMGHSVNHEQVTLEHVCPYNPDEQWADYFGEGVNDVYDRLGNMVLLSKDELKRADFTTKKSAYADSGFKLAQEVARYDEWNSASVNRYQTWLAEQAVQTWRVDYS